MGVQPGSGSEGPTVDSWSDKDQRIVVSQPAAGFLYDLVLRAKIDADPQAVYQVLIDPKSHEIFRGIRATLSRTTLEDDGKGRRKLRIGHRALTKFLWISVTFDTELYVWEDDVARTIRFTNARSDGFMSKFDGTWHVQPFNQQTLNSIYKGPPAQQQQQQQHHHHHHQQQPSQGHNWLGGILHHNSQASSNQDGTDSALVTLNQALAPRAKPPGPLAHLVRGLCGRVLHNMMEDLRAEVMRREQLLSAGGRLPSSKSRQVVSTPSLPVASLTLSRSSGGGRSSHSRWLAGHSSSEHGDGSDGSSGSNVLSGAAQALTDLLASAVPLHVTVHL